MTLVYRYQNYKSRRNCEIALTTGDLRYFGEPSCISEQGRDEMLYYQSSSDAVIIVLHEIYGVNSHIQVVCERFASKGFDVICPNLLADGQVFSYREEAAAYQNFQINIGFPFAQEQVVSLTEEVRSEYKYCYIVGYSVGATIAWLCSQRQGLYSGVVGYYGSRIRDYRQLVPDCPVLLFFPRKEENFDSGKLIQELSAKKNVRGIQVETSHGFCNPESDCYDPVEEQSTMRETIFFMKSQR